MKLARLAVLLVALAVIAVPNAFGAKGKQSFMAPSKTDACYDIYCYGVWSGSCCNTEERCLGYCDATCGVEPGTCVNAT